MMAAGDLRSRPGLISEKESFVADFFEILFLRRAKGYAMINYQKVELHDGMVLFLSQGDVQSWHTDEKEMEGCFVVFKEEFTDQFVADADFVYRMLYFYQQTTAPFLTLKEEQLRVFEEEIEQMCGELQTPVADSYNMAVAQFCVLLIQLNRLYAAHYKLPFTPAKAHYAFQFKGMIEKHIDRWQRVEDYASLLHISRISLNKYTQAQYGQTAVEMIKVRLIKAIKHELLFTDLALTQIAIKYGFSESSHLARFFKQRTGMTTKEFVENYQKGNN